MKEFLAHPLNLFGLAWWIEVITESPRCTYYFGPFPDSKTAETSKTGYLDDLEQEGAQGITVTIKRCKPSHLTVSDDLGESNSQRITGSLSSQLP